MFYPLELETNSLNRSALPLSARRAEEEARVIRVAALLAYHLYSSRAGYGPHVGRCRGSRCRIWNNYTNYGGNYSSDKYYSAKDEVGDISYAGKDVSRQDRPETGGKS